MKRTAAGRRDRRLQPRHGAGGSRAFTLVEAIVATAVLGLVVGAIYAAITTNVALVQLCRENETATQILSEKLDTIRLYNWEQINTKGFVPKKFTVGLDPGSTNNVPYFTGHVQITPFPHSESYGAELVRVTVTLEWLSGNRPQSRSMSTFVTRNGLNEYVSR